MRRASPPPLRYFPAADVVRAMPDLDTRLALAERTMIALVADAELPPKIGIHPRPEGSFVHAMPAHLRGPEASGRHDLVGMKWVAGFGTNNAIGLPAISALVVLNDPQTGPADRDPRRWPDHGRAHGGGVRRGHPPVRAGAGPPAARRAHRGRDPGPEPPAGARAPPPRRGPRAVRSSPRARRGAGRRGR